jgi:hypothetical protein
LKAQNSSSVIDWNATFITVFRNTGFSVKKIDSELHGIILLQTPEDSSIALLHYQYSEKKVVLKPFLITDTSIAAMEIYF